MEKNTEMLSLEEVKELLEDVLNDKASTNDVVISSFGAKGDGFMSFMTKADVGSHHFLIKWAPRTDTFRGLTESRMNFVREIYFYDVVFPALRRFQEDRNVSNPFLSVPRCYKTRDQEMRELIVLDNLKESGFTMWDRRIPMNDAHISLVLEEYGKLHAVSFAMKDQDRKLYESLEANLGSHYEGTNVNILFKEMIVKATERLLGLVSSEAGSKFYRSLEILKDDTDFLDSLSLPGPYDVIIHGDSWCNNFLFKHEDGKGVDTPTSMKFIDFQGARTATPIADLSYCFYTAASKEKLDNHIVYKHKYYESFRQHLKALGSDPEELFPLHVFEQEWKKFARFGLIIAMVLFNIMLREKDEAIDVSDVGKKPVSFGDVLGSTGKNEELINQKLLDLARHMYDNGYMYY